MNKIDCHISLNTADFSLMEQLRAKKTRSQFFAEILDQKKDVSEILSALLKLKNNQSKIFSLLLALSVKSGLSETEIENILQNRNKEKGGLANE